MVVPLAHQPHKAAPMVMATAPTIMTIMDVPLAVPQHVRTHLAMDRQPRTMTLMGVQQERHRAAQMHSEGLPPHSMTHTAAVQGQEFQDESTIHGYGSFITEAAISIFEPSFRNI